MLLLKLMNKIHLLILLPSTASLESSLQFPKEKPFSLRNKQNTNPLQFEFMGGLTDAIWLLDKDKLHAANNIRKHSLVRRTGQTNSHSLSRSNYSVN